jgi:hypothetical protein
MKTADSTDAKIVVEIKNGPKKYWYGYDLNGFTTQNKWRHVEAGAEIPEGFQAGDTLTTYMWDPKRQSKTFIDNFELEFIQTEGSYDYKP